ncbi:MAG: hypothetical protein F6K03_01325 [Kamptonema sp. SIO4C4]|nr:hypothetical protein [Kamptonema sp. SIO4C4]
MYSLDINFLNDRAVISAPVEAGFEKKTKHKFTLAEILPLIIGGVFLVLLPAAAGGYFLYIQAQQNQQQARLDQLEGDIRDLQAQSQEIQQLRDQIDIAQQQTAGLATVFTRILPWSAVLADLRDRIPANLQITSITEQQPDEDDQQTAQNPNDENGETEAAPSAPPMPMLEIEGFANSYNDVNFFLVTLQRSPFFDAENSRILSASLVDDPNQPEALELPGDDEADQPEDVTLPDVVEYTIAVGLNDLSDLPATELVNQLQNKGTLGSVIRLETLRNRGLLDVASPDPITETNQQQNNNQQNNNQDANN